MYCERCGSPLKGEDRFCTECGFKILAGQPEKAGKPPNGAGIPGAAPLQPGSRKPQNPMKAAWNLSVGLLRLIRGLIILLGSILVICRLLGDLF